MTRAFMDGLHRGCLVAGAAVVATGIVALVTMPTRLTAREDVEAPTEVLTAAA